MKHMGSMKSFVCSKEQIDNALDGRWVNVWKTDAELRRRSVARACFQDTAKMGDDAMFASTPWFVTMRIRLTISLTREWGCHVVRRNDFRKHFRWPPSEFFQMAMAFGN